MNHALLVGLDGLFFALHTALIGFNLVGWAWRRTRVAHRVVVGLTAFSWFVMGGYYGWGYCLCTDWHFQVRRALSKPIRETSFLQLLARSVGLTLNRDASNRLAAGVFAAIVVATVLAWIADRRRIRGPESRQP